MVEYANFLSTLFMRGQFETRNSKPETRNPKLETFSPQKMI
jgi:hypothetical protein